MAASYDLRERPNLEGDGKPQPLYPRIVSHGTICTESLLKEISEDSTFTVGDLEGVLVSLENKIANYLKSGYHVELGKIGYFSASLKARPVMDKKEIHAPSIEFDNVNFRASAWLRKEIRTGRLQRSSAGRGFRVSSQLGTEECLERLQLYLSKNAFITRRTYSSLTGRLKNKALDDLNNFVNQGVITRMGSGNQLLFVLSTVPETTV